MTIPHSQTQLLALLARLSFTPGDFTLASGQKSDYYIDCRITTLNAQGGRLAGIVMLDLIREHCPDAVAIGGLTMGADPLVSNIATASAQELADHLELIEHAEFLELAPEEDHGDAPTLLHGFLVRKAEKTHGTGRRIEGFLEPGARVVIVDDVCTTGGSTITALEAARDAGMQVVGVLALVDREQGGRLRIEQALAEIPTADDSDETPPFLTVFTANDVRRAHHAGAQ